VIANRLSGVEKCGDAGFVAAVKCDSVSKMLK